MITGSATRRNREISAADTMQPVPLLELSPEKNRADVRPTAVFPPPLPPPPVLPASSSVLDASMTSLLSAVARQQPLASGSSAAAAVARRERKSHLRSTIPDRDSNGNLSAGGGDLFGMAEMSGPRPVLARATSAPGTLLNGVGMSGDLFASGSYSGLHAGDDGTEGVGSQAAVVYDDPNRLERQHMLEQLHVRCNFSGGKTKT